jgi:hypothetical protein
MDKIKEKWTAKRHPYEVLLWNSLGMLNSFIKNDLQGTFVQPVVDAGFDPSYKKTLYPIYLSNSNGVKNARIFKSWRNERRFSNDALCSLPPVFVDDCDERLIQISDMVIGMEMLKLNKKKSDFNEKLISIIKKLDSQIKLYLDDVKLSQLEQ